MGYKTTTTTGNGTNGSIVIKPDETCNVTATAVGTIENGKIN